MTLSERPDHVAEAPPSGESAQTAPKRKISSQRRITQTLLAGALLFAGYHLLSRTEGPPDELAPPADLAPEVRRYYHELRDGNIFSVPFVTLNAEGKETQGRVFTGSRGDLLLEIDNHLLSAGESIIAEFGEPGTKISSMRKEGRDFATTLKPPLSGGKLLISADTFSDIATALHNARQTRAGTIEVAVDYRIVIEDPLLDMVIPRDARSGTRIIPLKVRYPEFSGADDASLR